jgi:hypothetical protein
MAGIILWWVDALSNPLAHMRAGRLIALSATSGSRGRRNVRHGFAMRWLHRVGPGRVARLAGDRSRIAGLPAMVARVLGAVVSTALAKSSIASAVFRPALVGQRSLRLGLGLTGYDKAIVILGAARFSVRLHLLLLQISGVQEFLESGLLLPQIIAMQAGQLGGDVARDTEVLRGCAVSGLGDDWSRPCRGRRPVQLGAQISASLTNLSRLAWAIPSRCVALRSVVLTDRGEDTSANVFDADGAIEEDTACLLQIFDELGRIGGEIEWCA